MNIETAISKLTKIIDTTIQATSADSPGGSKITLDEALSLALSAIGIVPAISAVKQLRADWLSRDSSKRARWSDAFATNFDLPDDEREHAIESIVQALIDIEGALQKLISSHAKKLKAK